MYLRMNGRLSTWAWSRSSVYEEGPVAAVAIVRPSALGDRVGPFGPAVVVFLRVDGHDGAHAVVSQSAQLRAPELILARFGRLEPDPNVHPGHGILLDTKCRHEERMNRVLRRERRDRRPVHRHVQLSAHGKVVGRADLA